MGIVFVLSFYQKSIFTVLVWSLGGLASHDSASLTSLIPLLLSCVRFRTSSTGGLTPLSTMDFTLLTPEVFELRVMEAITLEGEEAAFMEHI